MLLLLKKYKITTTFAAITTKKDNFAIRKQTGKVLEWLKRHAWKACKRRNRFGGSNPPLSAL